MQQLQMSLAPDIARNAAVIPKSEMAIDYFIYRQSAEEIRTLRGASVGAPVATATNNTY